jgi:hypothetical protein
MAWSIVLEPISINPDEQGRNMSGLVIYIEDGEGDRREHTRVTYIRRHSANPTRSFKRQMQKSIEEAYEAIGVLANAEAEVAAATKRVEDTRSVRETSHAATRSAAPGIS